MYTRVHSGIFCTRCDGGGVALSARAHNGMTTVRFVTVYECLSVCARNIGIMGAGQWLVLAFRRGVRVCACALLQEVYEISRRYNNINFADTTTMIYCAPPWWAYVYSIDRI